jgi:hypothetical protein
VSNAAVETRRSILSARKRALKRPPSWTRRKPHSRSVAPSVEKKTWKSTVSATMSATGLRNPRKVAGGTRLATTRETTPAAIRSKPATESTRKSPTASMPVARILARGSSSCSGEPTG